MSVNDKFMAVRPITVFDSLSSNIAAPAADDPALWNSATAYTAGQQVSRLGSANAIFQRVIGGTTATPPEDDLVNWTRVKSINRFRMFDNANNTQSERAENIAVTLTANTSIIDTVVLDNLDADSVRVQVGGYDRTIQLKSRDADDWFEYFFLPFRFKKTAVFTGLPLVSGVPVTITISAPGRTAKCGSCVVGLSYVIGDTDYGASFGIIDYSVKKTDAFGNTTVVQRAFSKRMNLPVTIENDKLEEIRDFFAEYRAVPLAWLAAGESMPALVAVGYYRSFDANVTYFTHSRMNIEIEGMT